METSWAAEHLQVIRTLMERSALYRRALAPVMTFAGVLGIAGALLGGKLNINSTRGFVVYWGGIALLALLVTLLLVRRQALKDAEPFWSPPTRRVAQAILLPFLIGLAAGLLLSPGVGSEIIYSLIIIWAWLYGCALHSAGFFISRGVRILGWIYGLLGCLLLGNLIWGNSDYISPHWLMGGLFGGLHLACGIYLYFTEKRKNAA